MFSTRLYYAVKPFVPWSVRMGIRRWFAMRKRRHVGAVWPILSGSECPPAGWPGWPSGKKFAFVLTHDVEGPEGLAKVRKLAELEMNLGFRSSFNFIPEGPYDVPPELRAWLVQNGFEVGVHDLHHDGKLFVSRETFAKRASRINAYLREWRTGGFRAGFMLRRLEWLHDLNVAYDATSFDTDPFEPQPDGVGTIFPFWIPKQNSELETPLVQGSDSGPETSIPHSNLRAPHSSALASTSDSGLRTSDWASGSQESSPSHHTSHLADGYVELPYTLPQDSTLFLLLREKSPEIWLRKLDWVAEHGGMSMVNVHPDYLRFPGDPERSNTFPVEHYRALLDHVRTRYAPISSSAKNPASETPIGHSAFRTPHSAFAVSALEKPPPSGASPLASDLCPRTSIPCWLALPRDVAAFVKHHRGTLHRSLAKTVPLSVRKCGTIWIDLENTPHIPFFKPIARELEKRGHRVVFTARDAYQTCEMADRYGLPYTAIGRHYGKQKLAKVWGLFVRSHQLIPFVIHQRPCLALSHGSRTQTYIANRLGIPTITIMDYEHTAHHPFWRPLWEIVPGAVSSAVGHNRRKGGVRQYSGIKEDVYVPEFVPDASLAADLKLAGWKVIVTVRPPATEAHYHNPEAEVLFEHVMKRVHDNPEAKAVLLPRSKTQEAEIRSKWPKWFADGGVVIPTTVVDGLNLLWHSDLVVSGGGTMNREAAAMGIPVYSIFRGRIGAVDKQLVSEGRLTLIQSVDDVYQRINLQPRAKNIPTQFQPRKALGEIVSHIEDILKHHYPN